MIKTCARGMPSTCTDCHKSGIALFGGQEAGPAIWSHNRHRYEEPKDYSEYTCNKCHHTEINNEPHLSCDRCHGQDNFADVIKLEDAVHGLCIDCHEKKGQGPVECAGCHSEDKKFLTMMRADTSQGEVWWNHAFHADNMAFSCRECHHNTMVKDGYSYTACASALNCPDNAADPQPCSNCHPRTGEYDEHWREREAKRGGRLKNLSLGEAVHESCVACHQRMGAGPVECEECHQQP